MYQHTQLYTYCSSDPGYATALTAVKGLRFTACPLACKSAANQSQMSRALLKPCSEGQGSLMLRDGEASVVVSASHLPTVSQTLWTPRAVPVGGLLAPEESLWLLACGAWPC